MGMGASRTLLAFAAVCFNEAPSMQIAILLAMAAEIKESQSNVPNIRVRFSPSRPAGYAAPV